MKIKAIHTICRDRLLDDGATAAEIDGIQPAILAAHETIRLPEGVSLEVEFRESSAGVRLKPLVVQIEATDDEVSGVADSLGLKFHSHKLDGELSDLLSPDNTNEFEVRLEEVRKAIHSMLPKPPARWATSDAYIHEIASEVEGWLDYSSGCGWDSAVAIEFSVRASTHLSERFGVSTEKATEDLARWAARTGLASRTDAPPALCKAAISAAANVTTAPVPAVNRPSR